ncbi:unnamed protein product [Notodromas monacha]|uniref:Vacuolar protein sorting-associated protein 18 homolog n=1 Tax=Notodromas monacha TaxID=399045 RepID=A0A7R9GH41_9CRUS|nr:unnamed protein product [Notodromas monacha]CAG0920519.1 unnamed protein product [Notodromas monacha]
MTSILEQYERDTSRAPRGRISGINARPENVMGTTGFINMKLEEEPPIFTRQQVNFSPSHHLSHLVSGGNRIVLAMKNKMLLKIQIDPRTGGSKGSSGPEEIDLSKFAMHNRISGVFFDPTGRHLIVSVSEINREIPLVKWKGHLITAVGWNPRAARDDGTGSILVGTSRGLIFEAELGAEYEGFFSNSCELYWKQVADLGTGAGPVSGIELWVDPGLAGDQDRYCVVVTTINRLYQFVAKFSRDEKPLLGQVFAVTGDPGDKFQEFPSLRTAPMMQLPSSCLRLFRAGEVSSVPKYLAWVTDEGIFHAEIECKGESVIGAARLIPYPDGAGRPLSMALTEFHVILCYPDAVRGISSLNDQLVFEDIIISDNHGIVVGVSRDPHSRTLWAFAEMSVFRYTIKDESRDVWCIFMDQGKFDLARKYAETNRMATDAVTSCEADSLFSAGKFNESAVLYAKTQRSFEEITLRFMDESKREALRTYLRNKLDGLKAMEKPQSVMLVTWLLELELNAVGELRDASKFDEGATSSEEYLAAKEVVKKFLSLQTVKEAVSECKNVIYELLSSHGDSENLVFFAAEMRDFAKVLTHHITRGNYSLALDVLGKHGSVDAFYKHTAALLTAAPRQTVDLLIAQGRRLVPATLVSPIVAALTSAAELGDKDAEMMTIKHLLRYLNFCVESLDARDAGMHNLLVRLLASGASDLSELVAYLEGQGRDSASINYSAAYALRVCEETDYSRMSNQAEARKQLRAAKVIILAAMGLHEKAVDAALTGDPPDIAAAQAVADDSEEDDADRRKRLWLKIARRVVEGGGGSGGDVAAAAVAFLNRCPGGILKLEDILPFFPDFATIDHFKDAVCSALQDYSKHIEALQEEMEEATKSTELIRQEIAQFQNHYCAVGPEDECLVCGYPLVVEGFYVFPCSHKFHSECMSGELYPILGKDQQDRLNDIKRQLAAMHLRDETASVNSGGLSGFSRRDQLKAEKDEIVASQCLLCGDHMIESVDKSFIEDKDYAEAVRDWL